MIIQPISTDVITGTKEAGGHPHPQISLQIPGYEIKREIGRGGMANVYLAVQQSLGREVALKVLTHELNEDSDFTQRFKKEGRILAQLLHPNIITIYDIGVSKDSQHFLSIEYLPSGTLRNRIVQGLSLDSTILIVQSIAKALEYAHERGVIHRDVKPSNIMFKQDGTPVLTDFGIAKIAQSETVCTIAGLVIGSPGYMSPEQAMGESASTQSDIYALGVVFYEMLTGHPLHEANSPIATLMKHLHDPIPELPKNHIHLQPIFDKLLAKKSQDRYKNVNDFLVDLHSVLPDNEKKSLDRDINSISVAAFASKKFGNIIKTKKSRKKQFLIATATAIFLAMIYVFALKPFLQQAKTFLNGAVSQEIPASQKKEESPLEEELIRHRKEELQRQEELIKRQREGDRQREMEATRRQVELAEQWNKADYYLSQALEYQRDGKLAAGLENIEKGLSLLPQHEGLTHLRDEMRSQMVEQQLYMEQAKQEQEVKSLLEHADTQRKAMHLTEPTGDNAEETYRQILKLNPGNIQAQMGLEQIAQEYLRQAQQRRSEGALQDSLVTIDKGLKIIPDQVELLRLQKGVYEQLASIQQREEQQRLEQQRLEQQRLEEKQRLEQQRKEQQRVDQQRLEEKQRLEQQRKEQQQRLKEKQRLEQQRKEQQRVDQQRLEEKQRLEQQREEQQQQLKEKQRLEQQRKEQQRVDQQRLEEKQRLEQQREEQQQQLKEKQRLEQQRKEQQRLEEKQRLEQQQEQQQGTDDAPIKKEKPQRRIIGTF